MAEPQNPQEALFSRLRNTLDGENATATFACGGKFISKFVKSQDGSVAPPDPVLYYDDHNGQPHKVVFPASADEMEELAKNCDPATFGLGGENRLDVEYRSAWKLDNTKFATSFHPFDSDIMEVIKQLLFSGAIHLEPFHPIIVAELYKLNIYKGPHDKFKPHIDTPRAQNQFGSLVVCLPCSHSGGELAVRHAGREVKFDWSGDSKEIQWAAFYSDCEHEVLPVTSGYRVTLTYNLYYKKSGNQILAQMNWKYSSLPLYEVFSEVLRSKDFMPHGGVLGVYCHHSYAHSSDSPDERLPKMMKGADAAFLVICSALGIETQACPIYDVRDYDEDYDTDDETFDYKKGQSYNDPLFLFGMETKTKEHLATGPDDWVGTEFCQFDFREFGDFEEPLSQRLRQDSDYINVRGIHWLNKGKFKEGELAYQTYGNEPSVDMLYSFAAILCLIPKWDENRGVAPIDVVGKGDHENVKVSAHERLSPS